MSTKKTYGEKLQHPKWQMRRLEIFKRDNAKCLLCGDAETTLHVHHLKYTGGNPWDAPDEDLKTLCEYCHSFVEDHKDGHDFPIRILKSYSNDRSAAQLPNGVLISGRNPDGEFVSVGIANGSLQYLIDFLTDCVKYNGKG